MKTKLQFCALLNYYPKMVSEASILPDRLAQNVITWHSKESTKNVGRRSHFKPPFLMQIHHLNFDLPEPVCDSICAAETAIWSTITGSVINWKYSTALTRFESNAISQICTMKIMTKLQSIVSNMVMSTIQTLS